MPPETNFWNYQNGVDKKFLSLRKQRPDDVSIQLQFLVAQFVKDRLKLHGLLSRKILVPVDVLPSAAVRHTLAIITRMASELERLHPRTFLNITLAFPETAPDVIENVGRSLFKHNDVTWGKIISFMTISSALACDCVRAGLPDIVQLIVDQTLLVISEGAASWIDKEGGFEALKEHIRPVGSEHITFLGWLGILTGFLLTVHWLTIAAKATWKQFSNIL